MTLTWQKRLIFCVVFIFFMGGLIGHAGENKKIGMDVAKGKEIFHERCAACHGADGNALLPNAPSFAKGERMEKTDSELLKTIKHGKEMMPPWEGVISDEEQLNTLNYVRVIVGDKVFDDKCVKCHEKIPGIPPDVPDNKALKDYSGTIKICKACEIEKELSRDEQIEVIKFIRYLGTLKK
ncbi:MAG: cytochrome c [Deltaproteobacteria bacterium]|nr:cytochrome c [Deltaproteobacteria bacterium]